MGTWIVFAPQIFLEIRDIIGKNTRRSLWEQVAARCAADKTLDMTVEDGDLPARGKQGRLGMKNMSYLLRACCDTWPSKILLDDGAEMASQGSPCGQPVRSVVRQPLELLEEAIRRYQSEGRDDNSQLPLQTAEDLQMVGPRLIKQATNSNL